MKERTLRTWIMGSILVASLLVTTGSLHGAVFIKIGDIKGESRDSDHKEWIDVLSWSWGASREPDTSGGGGAGKVSVQDLTFVKELDKSSPKLMESCTSGEPIPVSEFVMRRAGQEPVEYVYIRLREVLVTSYEIDGQSPDTVPTEIVSLNFRSIHVEYTPLTEDGKPGEKVEFSYDVQTNEPG